MPVIRINAEGDIPVLHGGHRSLAPTLIHALKQNGPVVVMVHGYSFLPHDRIHCPHRHIFSGADHLANPKALSWPKNLGFGTGSPDEGLAIAFGWHARGTLWAARETSISAARALARVIEMVRDQAPEKPVHIVAHSLGAHLALTALTFLQAHDLSRILVLNGATHQSHAHQALSTEAGKTCELFNIVSQENAVYDFLFESCVPASTRMDRSLGRGFTAANALTTRLDHIPVLEALNHQGYPIARPKHWYCHWSTYLRPGVFPFYQALLRRPERLPLHHLRRLFDEAENAPSVSRRGLGRFNLLPIFAKQAS
ncbi:alpha/beta hydrolase [Shimia thalassica]|uniref:alpha/beta hydrolase n=1 Tax=Shimia thalassica TaxID=1715693 RepID=UPI00273577C7|nr:alpha/beta hydrolase [Shimia thalassica]MDP2519211.1 alpha/beta hydrolase [Shimia thalassica]